MSYQIVIPSYNRSDTLVKKTLQILERHNIDPIKVTIFVANEVEKEIYQSVLPNKYKMTIVSGVLGMMNIRNFISDYYPKGTRIFFMDDDLREIYNRVSQNKLEPIKCLDTFIKLGFELCEIKDCKLFGVYPVDNAYFMKPTIVRGLVYCMGGAYGIINQQIKVTVNNKEDFERSIQYFKNSNGLIRFNNVCVATQGYSGKGGMQSFDRGNDVILEDANIIAYKYPEYCDLNMTKKSGKPEIKIRQKKLEEIMLFNV